jgi:transcriptional regulator with XRE-family HTH domain
MPDPLDVFAANLKRIRLQRGLSQERLAHSADLNMTHVAKIERSERELLPRSLPPTPRSRSAIYPLSSRDRHCGEPRVLVG